jgi:hypothetical protein
MKNAHARVTKFSNRERFSSRKIQIDCAVSICSDVGNRKLSSASLSSFARGDRTGDHHDAYCVAACLSRADQDGSLAVFLKPDLTPPERAVARVEGWILGVA